MLMPNWSYPSNPTPHQRSLRYKRGIEYLLEDDDQEENNENNNKKNKK